MLFSYLFHIVSLGGLGKMGGTRRRKHCADDITSNIEKCKGHLYIIRLHPIRRGERKLINVRFRQGKRNTNINGRTGTTPILQTDISPTPIASITTVEL